MVEEEEEAVLKQLQEAVDSNPDDPSHHFNLGVFLWEKGKESEEIKGTAAEHFVISAKLNPQNGAAFRYLGHYYSRSPDDIQRASKCYQRAITLNSDDFESGEALCDLLDEGGKETLEVSICREASEKSPRAFWAFRRLGYLQVYQKKWPEAVQSLQHAIRGYPTCADLWEALGLSYQRLGMFTAAIKSYGRAIELEDSREFALVESGNILLMLGSFEKGVEQFQQALRISPDEISTHYGLASGLLGLSKECITSGAFRWGASLLEEASKVAKACTSLAGNLSSIWKLHGDIQLTYAKCLPWMEEVTDTEAFSASILSWRRACLLAASCACRSYQRALHLAPSQANIYPDVAIASDLILSLKDCGKQDLSAWQLSEKMSLGSLLLESGNYEFWVAFGCLSSQNAVRQHTLIRSLQFDISLADAWAHLGKLYREEDQKQLARQAFDRARSIDPSLALPWAGMSTDVYARELNLDEAYESSLRAVQILPIAEFQVGLAKLALLSGHLSSSQVFGAIKLAVQRGPHYPESHNMNGLICEARLDYHSAAAAYRLARCAISTISGEVPKSCMRDISINLARSLCMAGNAVDAVKECEDLDKEGLLDSEGLMVYALSLSHVGKTDLALSVTRNLASSVLSLEGASRAASISFICRLLYYVSGRDSVIKSILKMPKDLFQSSKISFVVSAIHALEQSNQLDSVVSSSRSFLTSQEEITGMHFLITLGKLIKHGSDDSLGIQSGIDHLRKALHKYPNSDLMRSLLGYLLLSSKEWNGAHAATRCFAGPSDHVKEEEGLKSTREILGAVAVSCYSTANCKEKFSFPTCGYQCVHGLKTTQQLQRWLHHEPWNQNARYLLILNYLQKAREERFPRHLCAVLERLISVALSNKLSFEKNMSYEYQKFQLLLCASEISLQSGDHNSCINHAKSALQLSLPDSTLFFAHLLLCCAYAAVDNFVLLHNEYLRCLELKTKYHIGWICLRFIEDRYKLQTDSHLLELRFRECSKEIDSQNKWMAVYGLVQGLIAIWNQDFLNAEDFLAKSCSLAADDSCIYLCHGAICMELAKQERDSQFLSVAATSLRKARGFSSIPLPIVSILLAQAEGSLGFKSKWEKNLCLEWFFWPPDEACGSLLSDAFAFGTFKRRFRHLRRGMQAETPEMDPTGNPFEPVMFEILESSAEAYGVE